MMRRRGIQKETSVRSIRVPCEWSAVERSTGERASRIRPADATKPAVLVALELELEAMVRPRMLTAAAAAAAAAVSRSPDKPAGWQRRLQVRVWVRAQRL